MSDVSCLYCGQRIASELECCPHCHAPSHYQVTGPSNRRRHQFIRNFIILVVFVTIMILWLPR